MNPLFIDKLTLILLKDKKVLFLRSKGKDAWFSPGGKREEGETDGQALTREIKEELGVEVIPDTMQHYGIFQAQAHGKPEGTMVKITCYIAETKGELQPQSEIEEMAWFSSEDGPRTTITGRLILEDLHSKGHIL